MPDVPARARLEASSSAAPDFDVLVVGAGLSGVGAGCHLQARCPGLGYAILEARDAIGGTWDLFRYPGVRSDSDMHTLGYSFQPWRGAKAIADGSSILEYVRETAPSTASTGASASATASGARPGPRPRRAGRSKRSGPTRATPSASPAASC